MADNLMKLFNKICRDGLRAEVPEKKCWPSKEPERGLAERINN
jgi:hypothetical protein